MGTRATVFPRAMLAVLRGVGRDADVVLEVINGITFLTPLWLRKPRVAMIHHVHRELFMQEFPRTGGLLFRVLERWPLRLFYRRTPFLTISDAARDDLVREGIPRENITVEYLGVEPESFGPVERSPEPRLIFVGRLKAYKRVELLLDVLDALPGVALDVVGEGDHRPDIEAEIARRGLGERVHMHGYVDGARKAELYGRAWVNVTASASEGWSLTVMEAALCATPSAALAVGGLTESIIDGETGYLPGTCLSSPRACESCSRTRSSATASGGPRRAGRGRSPGTGRRPLPGGSPPYGRRPGADAAGAPRRAVCERLEPSRRRVGWPGSASRGGRSRGLAQPRPGRASVGRRRPRPPARADRGDRLVPGALDDRA